MNPRLAKTYYNRATVYRAKGEIERAIADYSKAIEIDPQHSNAYFGRGSAFEAKGDYDRAIADFTKAIEISPEKRRCLLSSRPRSPREGGNRSGDHGLHPRD